MATDIATQTDTVLDHHMRVYLAKDVAGIMEDYTEESVLIVNIVPEPIKGLAAIRAGFTQFLGIFTPEMTSAFSVHQRIVSGDMAYIVWSAGAAIPFASDTFVVRAGKIVAQTAAVQMGQSG